MGEAALQGGQAHGAAQVVLQAGQAQVCAAQVLQAARCRVGQAARPAEGHILHAAQARASPAAQVSHVKGGELGLTVQPLCSLQLDAASARLATQLKGIFCIAG